MLFFVFYQIEEEQKWTTFNLINLNSVRFYQFQIKSDILKSLPHSSRLPLGLEEGQDVAFSHWPLDVSEDASVGFVAELDSYLDTLTLASGSAENLGDFSESWLVSF